MKHKKGMILAITTGILFMISLIAMSIFLLIFNQYNAIRYQVIEKTHRLEAHVIAQQFIIDIQHDIISDTPSSTYTYQDITIEILELYTFTFTYEGFRVDVSMSDTGDVLRVGIYK